MDRRTSSQQYWKNAQSKRLNIVINKAGQRYTAKYNPKLNVQVSISENFDGIGRNINFYKRLKTPINKLNKNIKQIEKRKIEEVARDEYEKTLSSITSLMSLLSNIPNTGVRHINFEAIIKNAEEVSDSVNKCINDLQKEEARLRQENKVEVKKSSYENNEKFRMEIHSLREILNNLEEIIWFAKSKSAQTANKPYILLKGAAGSGKTHFLCDLTEIRIKDNLPTFIFLGEEFADKNFKEVVADVLGFNNIQQFLRDFNKYASNKGTRGLIIIDALNEGILDKKQWEELKEIEQYPNLGVILSVRSGFEGAVVPEFILSSYISIEHNGFVLHEWEALKTFFLEYKLPLPEIPVLLPEFRNPLFLKIFCESHVSAKNPIKGHYGFTHILEAYVRHQVDKIIKDFGGTKLYPDAKIKIWKKIIKEFALYMGGNGVDKIPEKEALEIISIPFPSNENKILGYLEKFGLVAKVIYQEKFYYKFLYQKFSDHLIVRYLLDRHLNTKNSISSFKEGTVLNKIIKDEWNVGLIEALAVQIPERLKGKDLYSVAPEWFRQSEIAKEVFLESLIWRALKSAKGKKKFIRKNHILRYIQEYILPYGNGLNNVLHTLLSIGVIFDHPFNANFLHKFLFDLNMPERDSIWLRFLDLQTDESSISNSYIVWALNNYEINELSLELIGIVLTWFLASSNRETRDLATKAMVSLFKENISVFLKVLKKFEKVDDLYITERLMAVAYGCVLLSTNVDEVSNLALYIYKKIFHNSKPPVHILLRDYARNTIEIVLTRNSSLKKKINLLKIKPPYGSIFPKEIISIDKLQSKYYTEEQQNPYGFIWSSLMYSNRGTIADFGNYIVNSAVGNWCELRLTKDGKRKKTIKEYYEAFTSSLKKNQKELWDNFKNAHDTLSCAETYLKILDKEVSDKEQIVTNYNKAKTTFEKSLNNSQKKLFEEKVLLYLKGFKKESDIDFSAIQRLIFSKVIKLGWKPELFSEHDRLIKNIREYSTTHRVERIGKKYQWIAFYEVLARIADNFVMRDDWNEDKREYQGTWQLSLRNIDPSFLFKKMGVKGNSTPSLKSKIKYQSWKPSISDKEWLKTTTDLPKLEKTLELNLQSSNWLILNSNFRWEQPLKIGKEQFGEPQRLLWYHVRSYLVKNEDVEFFCQYLKKQENNFDLDSLTLTNNVFLREFPEGFSCKTNSSFLSQRNCISVQDIQEQQERQLSILNTAVEYVWEANNYDFSIEERININLPAKEIIQAMQLEHGDMPGQFIDVNSRVIACDSSILEGEPNALLIKKNNFLKFIKKQDYVIVWFVKGEKIVSPGNLNPENYYGRLEVRGIYKMNKDGELTKYLYLTTFVE